MPLPFFDRNQGGIQEAIDRLRQAAHEQEAASARVTVALADAYRALATAHDDAGAIAVDLLPGAQRTFDAIDTGYRLGKFGYLDLLDAQRTLVSAQRQHLGALADYHKAAADVERLTGPPLRIPVIPPPPHQ